MPSQVENGKAFEYAIAKAYYDYLESENNRVWLQNNVALNNAKHCFEIQEESSRRGFYVAAEKTIETLVAIEPGLVSAKNQSDFLNIRLADFTCCTLKNLRFFGKQDSVKKIS